MNVKMPVSDWHFRFWQTIKYVEIIVLTKVSLISLMSAM